MPNIESAFSAERNTDVLRNKVPDTAREAAKERREERDAVERAIEERTGAVATRNKTEVIASGQDFFKTLEAEIGSAKQSIHINLFSFSNDSTGMKIADALIAAKRNNPELTIDVRVDRIGSFVVGSKDSLSSFKLLGLLPIIQEKMSQNGLMSADGSAQIFRIIDDPSSIHDFPPEQQQKWKNVAQEVVTDELLLSANASLRMLKDAGVNLVIEQNDLSSMDHSKVFIFDDTTLYSGGMNIGDDYSGGYDAEKGWSGTKKADYWKDYMVKMQGGASDIQRRLFFGEEAASAPAVAPEGAVSVRVLHNNGGASSSPESFAREKQISFATYHLLENAASEILVEHAYIMDQKVVDLLLAAAARGVSVKIVRSRPESKGLEAANERFFSQMEGKPNIQILKSDRVLHTKLLCVDSAYSIIGSANLTKESLNFHEETSLFIAHNDVQRQLDASLDATFNDAFGDSLLDQAAAVEK